VGRAALGELAGDPAAFQRVSMRLRIVGPVALDQPRLAERAAWTASERRNRVDQGQQLGDVVPICAGQQCRQRDAARLGENVVLRPRLTAIGWVRSSFFPPRNARTELLSTRARVRSNWPRWRNSASRSACSRRQTPARCHRTRRRQHVLPEPHPISVGSICHGSPLRKTNRMPVNAARSGTRGRPMFFHRRRGGFGRSGSIRLHRASSIRRWDMRDRLRRGHATVPIRPIQYKSHVSYF
jgi:general L-amino acid transport system substrate-binding protein